MAVNRRRYYRIVLRKAGTSFKGAVSARLRWGILLVSCTGILGIWLGPWTASKLTGLIISLGALLLAGILVFIWCLFSAPAEIHAEQEGEITGLRQEQAESKRAEPRIDSRLELLGTRLRLLHHSEQDIRRWELHNMEPKPSQLLMVSLGVKKMIGAASIIVDCDGPIYNAGATWKKPTEEPVTSTEHYHKTPERVIIPVLDPPLQAESLVSFRLYVEGTTRLREVSIMPPPDPPGSKAS